MWLIMSNLDVEKTEENTVLFQKMNIRDLFGTASCGNGIHITIPARLCHAFDIQPWDELLIRIEEVRYSNLRDIPERVDISKPKKRVKKET